MDTTEASEELVMTAEEAPINYSIIACALCIIVRRLRCIGIQLGLSSDYCRHHCDAAHTRSVAITITASILLDLLVISHHMQTWSGVQRSHNNMSS